MHMHAHVLLEPARICMCTCVTRACTHMHVHVCHQGLHAYARAHVSPGPARTCMCACVTRARTHMHGRIYHQGPHAHAWVHVSPRPARTCMCACVTRARTHMACAQLRMCQQGQHAYAYVSPGAALHATSYSGVREEQSPPTHLPPTSTSCVIIRFPLRTAEMTEWPPPLLRLARKAALGLSTTCRPLFTHTYTHTSRLGMHVGPM